MVVAERSINKVITRVHYKQHVCVGKEILVASEITGQLYDNEPAIDIFIGCCFAPIECSASPSFSPAFHSLVETDVLGRSDVDIFSFISLFYPSNNNNSLFETQGRLDKRCQYGRSLDRGRRRCILHPAGRLHHQSM
jgi:hypothetical protein